MKYLAPGVYVEEFPGNDKPISGSDTCTALMFGVTERGPVNEAVTVHSLTEFRQIFGGLLDQRIYTSGRHSLPYAAEGFFDNGGRQLVVWRLVGPGATCAITDFTVDVTGGASDSGLPLQRSRHDRRVPSRRRVVKVPLLRIRARSPGNWGNQLRVRIRQANAAASGPTIAPGALVPEYCLTVELVIDGSVVESEVFDNLGLLPGHQRYGPAIVGKSVGKSDSGTENGESRLIYLSDLLQGTGHQSLSGINTGNDALIPASETVIALHNGTDDLSGLDDSVYIRALQNEVLSAAQRQRQDTVISLVAVPGYTSLSVQKELVHTCEMLRYRFALLDAPRDSSVSVLLAHRRNFDAEVAAIYHPWLLVPDPFSASSAQTPVPPAGHVMGIYARTDAGRGVWKAPANEVVNGAAGLEYPVGNREQEVLNPANINLIRDFRNTGRGIRVWGSRTLSTSREWQYINVQRLRCFIELALVNGLQFSAFESNSPALWARVRLLVSNFLDRLWRAGALAGARQQDAFFVNVGYNVTMTQTDIDNRRMIVEAGIAVLKPAEFIIIRVTQETL